MSAGDFDVKQEPDAVSSPALIRVGVVAVVVGAIGVVVGGVVLALVVGSLQPTFAGAGGPRSAPRAISGIEQTPILQARAGEDLRDQQRRELDRWSWVDREAGVANIPIERAMDLVAEESR